jgi:phenylpropionate dioxygenase-like ring-hydroxylating dioxygenase large terminal subunit
MIPNQWYVILESNEVKKGKPVGFTRMGEKIVAWRDGNGKLSVMSDLCPHRGVALSVGEIKGDCIQCPFHGFEYDTSGDCKLIPANGRDAEPPKAMHVKTYPTREEHGFIYLWWGEPQTEYPPLPWFESISDDMVYSTLRDHWKSHYSRAIENQLDVVHLPFIHRTCSTCGSTMKRITVRSQRNRPKCQSQPVIRPCNSAFPMCGKTGSQTASVLCLRSPRSMMKTQ